MTIYLLSEDILKYIQDFVDITKLLNTSNYFYNIKKYIYIWKLNHEYSEKYINNNNFRKLLNEKKVINCNKQIYHLHLSKIKDMIKCQFISSLYLDNSKIEDLNIINQCNLYKLNLYYCYNIRDISSLANHINLQKLILPRVHNSSNIKDFSILEQLTNLQTLHIYSQIPDISILNKLTKLQELYLRLELINDISVLTKLTKLHVLSLSNKKAVSSIKCEKMYNTLSDLKTLYTLELKHINILKLNNILHNLKNLNHLYLDKCKITNHIDISGNIKILEINNCKCKSIHIYSNLIKLNISDCDELKNINIFCSSTIFNTIKISDCCNLENINESNKLIDLHELNVFNCENLNNINGFDNLKNLHLLSLYNCENLNIINGFNNLKNLYKLNIEYNKLSTIQFNNLINLHIFNIKDDNINNINGFNNLIKLDELTIHCYNLNSISGFNNLTTLHKFNISSCSKLDSISGFNNLTSLYELMIGYYYNYNNINVFDDFINSHKLESIIHYYNL
jgi:hypothetical protein